MNLKIKFSVFTLLIMLLGFSSCKKELSPVSPEDITIQDIQVSADFDWKTTKDIQITVTGNDNGLLQVTNADDIPYQKVYLTGGQSYMMNLTLPGYETAVKLKFMGEEVTLELTSNNLNYQF